MTGVSTTENQMTGKNLGFEQFEPSMEVEQYIASTFMIGFQRAHVAGRM